MVKKGKIDSEASEAEETLASSVRSYHTKEMVERIAAMSMKEMESVLKDLAGTNYFTAIQKYSSMRMPLLDATVRGTDPVKDPSKISWAQGAMAGLSDLEGYVIELNTPKPQQEQDDEEPVQTRPEGVIVG